MPHNLSFEEYLADWLTDVQAGSPSTIELGRRFAHKLITQWLDTSEISDDDLIYCDGTGDGGIDAAYLHRGEKPESNGDSPVEGDTWYLIQSKYGTAFQGTDTLLREGVKVIEALDNRRERLSSLAQSLLARIKNFRTQASELDRIVLVFATLEPLTDTEKQVLEDLRTVGRERLGREDGKAQFDVEAVSVATIYQRLDDAQSVSTIRVPIQATIIMSAPDLMVGAVSLTSMYDFLKSYRDQADDLDQLYEKNVRRFLGSRNRVNRAILDTLKDTPEKFGLYNNGITIVVADFEAIEEGNYQLVEPYVVNGCQTTRTIWEVCRERLEAGGTGHDANLADWRQRASEGVVVTKIVKVGADGDALLRSITKFTNSQNAVRQQDFLTLTDGFKSWANQMKERYGVFMEVQRGEWESRRAYQRQRPDIHQYVDSANAFDLLKVYGAGWLGEAGTAFGRNAAFLPNGPIFKRIMGETPHGGTFGVDDFGAAYCLQKTADNYQFGRGAERQSRRQTRFLFYMVVIELLKDVMMRSSVETSPKNITSALIKLYQQEDQLAVQELMDTAIELIDEYLTRGQEDSVFLEPRYQETNDLNSYLKMDQLGKTEEVSPHLRSLIASYRRDLRRSRQEGQPSTRDLITAALFSP